MNRAKGFTLIELALVLVIAGAVLAGMLQPLKATFEQARNSRTRADLSRIHDVVLGYAASQSRPHLPCADCRVAACASAGNQANDGLEDRNSGGACDAGTALGNLPWNTLGLSATDAWGNQYSYRVAPGYGDASTGIRLDTGVADSAQVSTRNAAGQARTMAANLPVLYFSHGANGRGGVGLEASPRPPPAAGSDEAENLDDDRHYFSAPPRRMAAGEEFDDVLGWIGVYELKAYLIRAGRLP